MNKLMTRWNIEKPWQLIVIFFVFSITGSSSIAIGRPILKFIGITLENLNAFMYYPLFIVLSFIFYQLFLVLYGWIFGQFHFFWTMEKKMLNRFGITFNNVKS
ncbi:DUF6787 family protein [Olleya sp. UBA1516]|uniref:DUF6787 family protein n=1 Tax=Olleya sp. UBA1516 TaxID=1947013 RepID=UPI0025FC7A26|nr:DUF6787 family protein [Olleya sp. UBA1516]|tara:strand:+ start:49463 stop:49771 length:309 start_codon:yes stop_codon:yes gene_type:complete